MDQFSQEELKNLMQTCGERCLSLYLPTHRASEEGRQDAIRLKNLIREAEERLVQGGLRRPEARDFLKPLRDILADPSVWQYRSDGMALFLSPKLVRYYRLPLPFAELLVVGRRFHLKPLIPLLAEDQTFFLLALSQKDVRLLKGTRFGVRELELDQVPKSVAEALKYDDPERSFQFKSKVPVGTGGRRFAFVFSHGVALNDTKDYIRRFLLQVDRGLQDVFRMERSPLVLAGVEYLLPLYREVNTYPHLIEEEITGNPELLSPEELHAQVWGVVGRYFQKDQDEVIARYQRLAGTGKASGEIADLVPAAVQGRVDSLVVARDAQIWGTFQPEAGTIIRKTGNDSEDLADLAAVQTLLNGGMVYLAEPAALPKGSPVVAVFRY